MSNKPTNKRATHHTRSECPLACALDVLGDHWTLLIIRAMMFMGCHEYKDMLAMPEGISSNILSDRLQKLEEAGIVASAPHPTSKRRKLYYLTATGKDLFYVMREVVSWADRNLQERCTIPEDKRFYLDAPVEEVAQLVFGELAKWEAEFLPTYNHSK